MLCILLIKFVSMRSPLSVTLLFTLLMCACSKDEGANKDRILPKLEITSPTNNQVVTAGSTVNVTGNLSDNGRLVEVHVHISNKNTGDLLIDIHRYPSASSFALNESFQVEAGIEYRIQVIAKDDATNENRATVEISSN